MVIHPAKQLWHQAGPLGGARRMVWIASSRAAGILTYPAASGGRAAGELSRISQISHEISRGQRLPDVVVIPALSELLITQAPAFTERLARGCRR